jgi:hypothetical protein
VENFGKLREPVDYNVFSTGWTHRANRLSMGNDAVFPVVHTPYVLLREDLEEQWK